MQKFINYRMNIGSMETLSHFIRDLSIPGFGNPKGVWTSPTGHQGIASLSVTFSMKSFSALSLPLWSHLPLLLSCMVLLSDYGGLRLLLILISPAFSDIQLDFHVQIRHWLQCCIMADVQRE